jgi:hypothetical protein
MDPWPEKRMLVVAAMVASKRAANAAFQVMEVIFCDAFT